MSRKLVAYFSASGVTARAAKVLAESAEADLYEIKPQIPYTDADLDWTNASARSTKEMKGQLPYPELADKDVKIENYDVVFVGFPIWWYVAPTIINMFLESYDFSGKTVVLFATSQVSGMGKTREHLQRSIAFDAKLVEGGMVKGNWSAAEMKRWLEKLDV